MELETRPSEKSQLFVLRVWHEMDAGRRVWRASLRQGAREKTCFATPDALVTFLLHHMVQGEPSGE